MDNPLLVDTINGKPSSLQLLVNPLIYNIHPKYKVKIPSWQEANQLAMCNCSRGVAQGTT